VEFWIGFTDLAMDGELGTQNNDCSAVRCGETADVESPFIRTDVVASTVRAASAADAGAIRGLALDNGMFEREDMGGFDEMLGGYLDGSLEDNAWWWSTMRTGTLRAYYAPEPFADRMWNLYFLAVRPGQHRAGLGSTLVAQVEDALRSRGAAVARVLIAETSSLDG